jgi:4-aminobutyrate aminotransferase
MKSLAAIVIEPVQGEGGYIPSAGLNGTKSYLKFLREFCDKHGILLIFDEVQCGMGRTGKWFASEYYEVVPDIQIMAKGLSGGMPLGAFATRKELMYKMPPGSHGTTFGGNPISCRAALKLIEILQRDKVMDNVLARGEQVFKFFESKFPVSDTRKPVADGSTKTNDPKSGYSFSAYHNPKIQVRGLGLMLALVFPDAEQVNKIKKHAFDKNVLLLGCGTYANIIRLAPDLIISEANLQKGLDIIAEVIN